MKAALLVVDDLILSKSSEIRVDDLMLSTCGDANKCSSRHAVPILAASLAGLR
jgi:hypothetical protein